MSYHGWQPGFLYGMMQDGDIIIIIITIIIISYYFNVIDIYINIIILFVIIIIRGSDISRCSSTLL